MTQGGDVGRRLLSKKRVFLALGSLILLPVSCCICCPSTLTPFEWQYRYRIHVGMPLRDAEAILGPAKAEEAPPGLRHDDGIRPVVQGEQFYVWEKDGMEIWVGVRGGVICAKYFDFPSL
jgi:hypothetical protein